MADSTRAFRVNEPHVIHQLFDQELVAVHLTTGTYHSLPGIAGEVFLAIGGAGASVSDIAHEFAMRYDASVDVLERDLGAFLLELERNSIMAPIERAPPRPPLTTGTGKRAPYTAPRLESFTDLQELFLLDPVHDVGVAGWPNVATAPVAEPATDTRGISSMRCRLAGADVIFERFDTETVVLNLGSGAYYSLSGPAEDIFLLLPEEPTIEEIRDALVTKYSAALPDLEEAVRDYLGQLSRAGIIAREAIAREAPRTLALAHPGVGQTLTAMRLETFTEPEFNTSAGGRSSFGSGQDLLQHGRFTHRSADLLYSVAGGEMVVSDRGRGEYFKLNEPASDVFRLLAGRPNVSEIEAALKQKYMVHDRDLRAAVMILLWNLGNLELIEAAGDDSPPARPTDEIKTGEALIPFSGFDVAVHRDLKELMRPFNTAPETRPQPNLSHVRQFVGFMRTFFEDAAEGHGLTENTYEIAGKTVKIRSAGVGQTVELQNALQHVRLPQSTATQHNPDLTIHVWNHEAATPRPLVGALLRRLHEAWTTVCGPRGEFLDLHCGPFVAIYHPGPDTLSLVDQESGHAFYLLRNDAQLPFWELSAPFRYIFHSWFGYHGLQYTHAGAVGVADTGSGDAPGILLVGKGGSGKSTTSLLCVEAGMAYAADDYCLTDAAASRVFSLYNTAKLKGPDDLERVPSVRGHSVNVDSFEGGGTGKGTFNVSELWPERMAPGFSLRAIVLPLVTGDRDSRLEACSAGDALLALAPSTVAQLPAASQSDCQRLTDLAETLPAYRLHLGSDLAQIPDLVKTLLV